VVLPIIVSHLRFDQPPGSSRLAGVSNAGCGSWARAHTWPTVVALAGVTRRARSAAQEGADLVLAALVAVGAIGAELAAGRLGVCAREGGGGEGFSW